MGYKVEQVEARIDGRLRENLQEEIDRLTQESEIITVLRSVEVDRCPAPPVRALSLLVLVWEPED